MTRHTGSRDDSHDLLHHYLQEIARIPRLTPEEEQELGRRIQENPNDAEAIERLVKSNLRFVISYAKRFRNAHVNLIDLINEGNIGLIQAARKFDPGKNVKFITYAVWWIRQAILHALSEQAGAFRIPPKRANLMYRLEKMIGAAHSEQAPIPTADDLARELGVEVKEVERLLRMNNENFSLTAELSEGSESSLLDVIEQTTSRNVQDELEEESIRLDLLNQISGLSPKERLVLSLRHGLTDNIPKRLSEIAEFLGRGLDEVREFVADGISTLCERLEVAPCELVHLLLYISPHPKAEWHYRVTLGDVPAAELHPIAASRGEQLERLRQQGAVQRELQSLPPEQRTAVTLRFGIFGYEEMTLRDIGGILGLSRERVRQIEARAEAKCRRSVRRDGRAVPR